jgi:hypothetical protein
VETSARQSSVIVAEHEKMLIQFKDCISWFGEDPNEAGLGPDTFFHIFVSFGQMLLAADRDNERKRVADERRVPVLFLTL